MTSVAGVRLLAPSSSEEPSNNLSPSVRWLSALFAPVDIASLIVFRIGFGLIMAAWATHYLVSGRVTAVYIAPRFHFTYPGLDFIQPWPGVGMTVHFIALAVLAISVTLGWFYRAASVLFAAGFTYVFLLDRTNYQNHYYLLMLVSWTLALLPLGRCFSVDVLNQHVERSQTTSAWGLWLLRFHIALPYFFGGIAKINADWFAGEPIRTHLKMSPWNESVGAWISSEPMVHFFIWGGLFFDLAIVPLILWSRTRLLAYAACVVFHLLNATLFNIHIFPWFMILATTVFFSPSWPRFWLRLPVPVTGWTACSWATLQRPARLGVLLGAMYCFAHLLIPLRHCLYEGNSMWTERGHYFAWRMMLRGKIAAVRFYLTDKETGETAIADFRPFITPEQLSRLSRDPEMILHCAHLLAEAYGEKFHRTFAVHALVLSSLNGRKPQLLIDPNVDLTAEPLGLHHRNWIMPLTEPLRTDPWTAPVSEWERLVELPPLAFLKPSSKSKASFLGER